MSSNLWLEKKYASILSYQLPLCSTKSKDSRFALNFRCIICGDSKTDKYKKRGWIHERDNSLYYGCFNCGHNMHFTNFLKEHFPAIYSEFRMEAFKEKMLAEPPVKFTHQIEKFDKRRIQKFEIFDGIPKISQLENDHVAKAYIIDRKIPSDTHFRIYYVDKFKKWVNVVQPDTFDTESLKYDEPRIVFPFIDQAGYVFGFQGRSLNPESKLRYISIMLMDDRPKVFGLDMFDPEQTGFVVEGPIDSLFMPNCLAMAGADAQLELFAKRSNTIIIFDNEPRNPEIVSRIHKYVDQGWKVCLWPDSIPRLSEDGKPVKDINDMVRKLGYSPDYVRGIVLENFYSGLQAKMKLITWDKSQSKSM